MVPEREEHGERAAAARDETLEGLLGHPEAWLVGRREAGDHRRAVFVEPAPAGAGPPRVGPAQVEVVAELEREVERTGAALGANGPRDEPLRRGTVAEVAQEEDPHLGRTLGSRQRERTELVDVVHAAGEREREHRERGRGEGERRKAAHRPVIWRPERPLSSHGAVPPGVALD